MPGNENGRQHSMFSPGDGEGFEILRENTQEDASEFAGKLRDWLLQSGACGTLPALHMAGLVFPVGVSISAEGEQEFSCTLTAGRIRIQTPAHVVIDSAETVYRGNLEVSGEAEYVDFSKAIFEGDSSFSLDLLQGKKWASFTDARFREMASFEGTRFWSADFIRAIFWGGASFEGVGFEQPACFLGCALVGFSWFNKAVFDRGCDFDEARFAGRADFSEASFGCIADFRYARFRKCAFFSSASFRDDVSFYGARFTRGADFVSCSFSGEAQFERAVFSKWGGVDFDYAQFTQQLSFAGASIKGAVSFRGSVCHLLSVGDDRPTVMPLVRERGGLRMPMSQTAREFWRFAQRVFAEQGEPERADAAYYLGRVAQWRVLRRRIKLYYLLWICDVVLLRWPTAYGASLPRLLVTWFVTIGAFGALFSMLPHLIGKAGSGTWTLWNWTRGIYYSVATFTTLGLGELNPGISSWGRILTASEAFLGAILMALAVLVAGRKFMRQR